MTTSQSFQLPDLLNIIGSLELRTNPHCRLATDASEKWICKEIHALSQDELTSLRAAKIGLLAGLSFPTCDAPQLRLLIDFMTLLFYSGITKEKGPDGRGSRWGTRAGKADANADESQSGIDILGSHDLLKHAIHSQIKNLSRDASPLWKERFAQSVRSFRTAQEQLLFDPTTKIMSMPSVEAYVEMRRELYGSSMTLDIAELLQIFQLPEFLPEELRREEGAAGAIVLAMGELKRAAFDVIAWSTDVVSYQRGNNANLVAVLMVHRTLSVQGAMNVCGQMIRGAFASFCDHEQRILELLVRPQGTTAALRILSRVWTGSPPNAVSHDQEAAVKRYIKALKDCIVGITHWIYETELFFGKKGNEIRSFGWIFVDQAPDDT